MTNAKKTMNPKPPTPGERWAMKRYSLTVEEVRVNVLHHPTDVCGCVPPAIDRAYANGYAKGLRDAKRSKA